LLLFINGKEEIKAVMLSLKLRLLLFINGNCEAFLNSVETNNF